MRRTKLLIISPAPTSRMSVNPTSEATSAVRNRVRPRSSDIRLPSRSQPGCTREERIAGISPAARPVKSEMPAARLRPNQPSRAVSIKGMSTVETFGTRSMIQADISSPAAPPSAASTRLSTTS